MWLSTGVSVDLKNSMETRNVKCYICTNTTYYEGIVGPQVTTTVQPLWDNNWLLTSAGVSFAKFWQYFMGGCDMF
jgi:hypothetical protein